MFNIYQFEKQAGQDPATQVKWAKEKEAKAAKRKSASNATRERLVAAYKNRVTNFLKDMTVKPVTETDYYGKGFSQMSCNAKMMGPQRMNFGAPRKDDDRLKSAKNKHSFIDSCPAAKPEWIAWQMRPRQKDREIGPSMRFNSHFQAERLMESLKNQTQTFFVKTDITGEGKETKNLEKNIREYNKTGRFALAVNSVSPNSSTNENKLKMNTTMSHSVQVSPKIARQSHLQRANYFLEPKNMMKAIHQKTHFKAAISISRGDQCCVKVQPNEFGDQFAEIARNIEAMNRSAIELTPANGKRGSQVGDWLKRNRNCFSQGGARRMGKNNNARLVNAPNQGLGETEPQQSNNISQLDNSAANVMTPKDATSVTDWNSMSEEEKKVMQMMSQTQISPEKVTNQVLKICNVIRQPLSVNGTSDYMKKRSGLGGTGGRELSPELRIRFGTYGFNKKDKHNNQQNQVLEPEIASHYSKNYREERVTSATTQQNNVNSVDFEHSSQACSTGFDRRATMPVGRADRINVKDSMETSDSIQQPPMVQASVNMGMSDETIITRSGSVGSRRGAQRYKKQVVLRKPFDRTGTQGNSKLIQSLNSMPARLYSTQESVQSPTSGADNY